MGAGGVGVETTGIVGTTGIAGMAGMADTTLSTPSGANGFGLPSVPSGISKILESCKFINALSDKMASSNFIFLTLRSKFKKSLATEDPSPEAVLDETEIGIEETRVSVLVDVLMKKI
ncbi:MAG: hypothetical protein Q7K54_01690 [Candidatus Parcubacteria bacterium]|nr:hypothetical protein [Candidatus Parcubacteria bacterium]